MKRRYKILWWLLGTLGVALVGIRLVLSHESACGNAPPIAEGAPTMKGWVHRCYGGPEILQFEELAKPTPEDDSVIVKVRFASVNPLDWHTLRGKPYFMRMDAGIGVPTESELGVDFAGVVDSVGKSVTKFKPGDEVFGARSGAFSEFVRVKESGNVVHKPANASFEQAAAIPIAAITALQALRDNGQLKAGQKVLINGASGGVGTFAVQIAKALGAEVTGVCSGRNVELVRSLGADHVIDYTKEDFTKREERYDLIFDNVNNHSFSERRRVLKPDGICVLAGIGSAGLHRGQLARIAGNFTAVWRSRFVDQKFKSYVTASNQADLKVLSDFLAEGKVTPFVEKTYALDQIADALRYFEEGHARGKLVVKIGAVVASTGELTSDEYIPATGFWATQPVRSVGLTREVNH